MESQAKIKYLPANTGGTGICETHTENYLIDWCTRTCVRWNIPTLLSAGEGRTHFYTHPRNKVHKLIIMIVFPLKTWRSKRFTMTVG